MGKLAGLLLLLLSSAVWGDVIVNPAPFNSTNVILNQITPQVATFNVSSGTVSTQLNATQIHFIAKNCVATALDGTCLLSMPDVNSMYLGYNVDLINTGGTFNFAAGPTCMPYPGSGNFNSCIGPFGMSANVITTAENNNSMGYAACGALRAGFYNSCMGGSSGNALRDGSYNSYNGAYSGFSNIDNNGNTFSGFECGRYTNGGDYNTGAGYQAGNGTSVANANVAGSGNTYLGKQTGQSVVSATVINNSIAIGNGALVSASNQAQIGGTSGTGLEVELRVSSITASGGWTQLSPRTLNELRTTTPTGTGQEYYCSDCVTDSVAVSSGTTRGAFARVASKTTFPS